MTNETLERAIELKQRIEKLDCDIEEFTELLDDGGIHTVVISSTMCGVGRVYIRGELANNLLKSHLATFKETKQMLEKELEKL